jgi:hypothetical protein
MAGEPVFLNEQRKKVSDDHRTFMLWKAKERRFHTRLNSYKIMHGFLLAAVENT